MAFLATEILRKKRQGQAHSAEEIQQLINDFSSDRLPDYQMSAWLMAAFINGLNGEETHHLTQAMLHSGKVLDFSNIPLAKVDKHSTGGVGDKASLILAPIVACADIAVPMISGRGLGHSGGTLDKLESIPGFSTQLTLEDFQKQIREMGLSFIGQTEEICPADKRIYALRDVTSTVESQELICASIMSKKLAEGIDALVLDVKFGSGAFMKTIDQARELATKLMEIGRLGGKKVAALLTNMEQPLGRYIGNALEIHECVEILKNTEDSKRFADTTQLSLELAGAMIWLGGSAKSAEEGVKKAKSILESGKAFEKFDEVCRKQGGDLKKLPTPKLSAEIKAESDGFVTTMNTQEIGLAGIMIGAGRQKADDPIDPTAGFEIHRKLGDKVNAGDTLLTMYGADNSQFANASKRILSAIELTSKETLKQELIAERLF